MEIPSDADAVRIHPLTMYEEEEYFRRTAKHPDLYDVGRLIINQGMRPDEVIRLAKVDFDLHRRLIHIRNGKSSAAKRSVPMTSESKEILEQRMQGKSSWIFPSPKDSSRHIGKINSTHNRVLAEARKEGARFLRGVCRTSVAVPLLEGCAQVAVAVPMSKGYRKGILRGQEAPQKAAF